MSSPNASGKKKSRPTNCYAGYSVASADSVAISTDCSTFFSEFVESRRPALLNHDIPIDISQFTLSNIEKRLDYDQLLQVERKHAFGFGLGTQRELKTLAQIVHKLKLGDDTYYLTTQYEAEPEAAEDESDESGSEEDEVFEGEGLGNGTFGQTEQDGSDESDFGEDFDGVDDFDELNASDDDDDDDADPGDEEDDCDMDYVVPEHKLTAEDATDRVKTLLQPPLTNVANHGDFPIVPSQFDPLVTQQINLWMGCATTSQSPDLRNPTVESLGKYVPKGNSSGLHHDHADNLYVLVEGSKRFTLYLPGDAEKLFTVGNIKQVYSNGLIDYKNDANAPAWRPLRADGAIISDRANWKLLKGGLNKTERQKLIDIIEKDEQNQACTAPVDGAPKMDPPSFSKVPPILAHLDEVESPEERKILEDFANKEFPGFLDLNKIEVSLQPGDMLYLPAGWFHEVTSFGGSNGSQHVAINWWFVPPTGNASQPYDDEYWNEDFQATMAALDWVKSQSNPVE